MERQWKVKERLWKAKERQWKTVKANEKQGLTGRAGAGVPIAVTATVGVAAPATAAGRPLVSLCRCGAPRSDRTENQAFLYYNSVYYNSVFLVLQ